MNAPNQDISAQLYVHKEGFKTAYPWFLQLKQKGLNPLYITMDGEQSIIRAIKKVWPKVKIQRCLYHIQHEGMRWLRSHPVTAAGKELRAILRILPGIKTIKERNLFIQTYRAWLEKYKSFVMSLPQTTNAFKDLKRTRVLIDNALPDMFHYLKNGYVPSTTNALEGFHSRLKSDYQRHRGLIKEHRIQYIRWYCYFKNKLN
jgi:transposase-like protein